MKYLLPLVNLLRCVIKLGPWQSFKLIVLAPRMDRTFAIKARGYARPITIRGKTSDGWVLNSVIVCTEYSGFILTRPQKILDGGANIGLATLYFSKLFPDAEIIAVEPDDDNFKLLVHNTRHLTNVTPVQSGLWSRPTQLSVQYTAAEKYAIRVIEDENGAIQAHSIPSLMEEHGWNWIDVIKLDVEGSEVPILMENTEQWIEKFGSLIIEIHQDIVPNAARALFKAFSEQDFNLRWRGENLILRRITSLGSEK